MSILLFSIYSWAHDATENRIAIEPEVQGSYNAGMIAYSFQLFDGQSNKSLTNKDLALTQTKILHFITYDPSRSEFRHVHPAFNGKVWSVDLNLLVNGYYFLWAQGQLIDGTEFSTYTKAQIMNGKPEIPVTPLKEKRKASDGMTTLELDSSKLKAGKLTMLNYKVTRLDGQNAVVTPYLGALAHVIAVSPDGDELIHIHPMAGSSASTGMVHATFPTEGDYRIWIQLIDRGELRTIPLSVVVSK